MTSSIFNLLYPDLSDSKSDTKINNGVGTVFTDNVAGATDDFMSQMNTRYANLFSNPTEAPWYKNGRTLSGYAGLASALTGIAGFGDQKKLLNTQTKALKQNIAFAKQDQDRRNKNIAGFNSYRSPSSPTSAFATYV